MCTQGIQYTRRLGYVHRPNLSVLHLGHARREHITDISCTHSVYLGSRVWPHTSCRPDSLQRTNRPVPRHVHQRFAHMDRPRLRHPPTGPAVHLTLHLPSRWHQALHRCTSSVLYLRVMSHHRNGRTLRFCTSQSTDANSSKIKIMACSISGTHSWYPMTPCQTRTRSRTRSLRGFHQEKRPGIIGHNHAIILIIDANGR